jgi:hypothetical protein
VVAVERRIPFSNDWRTREFGSGEGDMRLPRLRTVLVSLSIAASCAGCATIPDEAAMHAERLQDFATKTNAGTVASFECVGMTLDKVMAWSGAVAKDAYGAYATDFEGAAKAEEDCAQAIAAVQAQISASNPAQAEALGQIAKACQERKAKYATWAADTRTLDRDGQAYVARKRDEFTAARQQLKALISSNFDRIVQDIGTYRDLFISYQSVALARGSFLGTRLGERMKQLEDVGSVKLQELSQGAEKFTSTAGDLTKPK